MLVNNIANMTVSDDKLITFKEVDISYSISTSAGELQGTVSANSYRNISVTSLGAGPYTVSLGYVDHSWQAAPVQVQSANALVTFSMAFPAGPNGPQTLVYNLES